MNIAGVIKDWVLIFFSYYLFGAPVTALNLLGYSFCCTGVRSCLLATALLGYLDMCLLYVTVSGHDAAAHAAAAAAAVRCLLLSDSHRACSA